MLAGRAVVVEVAEVNGSSGLMFWIDGRLDTVASVDLVDGVATRLWVVRNPAKLAALG